jgi:thiol:disulfide interchange protein DsbD
VAVAYGGALIVGAAAGGTDPLRPFAGFGSPQVDRSIAARTMSSVPAFETALQAARAAGKPVLVEYAADGCTVCRTIERTVLVDAGIRETLKAVSIIRADVTRDDAGTRALMRRFEVVGPPTLILMRPDGRRADPPRPQGLADPRRRLRLRCPARPRGEVPGPLRRGALGAHGHSGP